jgi:hypothetical protein
MCIAGDEDEENTVRDLAPEDAARLRSQMEELLQRGGEARAAAASDEQAMRYGREMWARCEALTSGLPLYQMCTFVTVCAAAGTCRGCELGSGAEDFMNQGQLPLNSWCSLPGMCGYPCAIKRTGSGLKSLLENWVDGSSSLIFHGRGECYSRKG